MAMFIRQSAGLCSKNLICTMYLILRKRTKVRLSILVNKSIRRCVDMLATP